MHLYCDESGNTGVNLLNTQQPVFVLAGTLLDSQSTERILARFAGAGRGEVKYSSVKRSARGQKAWVSLLESGEITAENCAVVGTHKRFYLSCQLVDKLIEPEMHDRGIDLYAHDKAASLANLFHFAGSHAFPGGRWDRVLIGLERALRERSSDSCEFFYEAALDAADHAADGFEELEISLRLSIGTAEANLSGFTHSSSFDPALDSLVTLVSWAMDRTPGRFPVTHDASKPLAQQMRMLESLMLDGSPEVIGYPGRTMELPLRISDFRFEDSKSVPQLQLADLLSGCAADCLAAASGHKAMEDFHRRVLSTPFNDIMIGGVTPSPTIRKAEAPAPGQISLVDGSMRFLRRAGYFD
jgi:hypothetical protein